MSVPTLETSRILLRQPHLDDAPAIFLYAHDPVVSTFTHWKRHTSLAKTRRFIHAQQQASYWVIIDKTTDTLIGECGFLHTTLQTAGFHCALGQPFWGKGLAKHAANTLIEFGFSECSLQKIYGYILNCNQRSLYLANALSMNHEATLPHQWYAHNHYYDVLIYSLKKGVV